MWPYKIVQGTQQGKGVWTGIKSPNATKVKDNDHGCSPTGCLFNIDLDQTGLYPSHLRGLLRFQITVTGQSQGAYAEIFHIASCSSSFWLAEHVDLAKSEPELMNNITAAWQAAQAKVCAKAPQATCGAVLSTFILLCVSPVCRRRTFKRMMFLVSQTAHQ
jgi:hypothetical protein